MSRHPEEPARLNSYRDVDYKSMVLAADGNFISDANRVVEYEMPGPKGGKRIFSGWYKSRGAYGSGS